MANKRVSNEVIAARMAELRNLRKLHRQDQVTKAALREEVQELRALVAALQQQNQTQAIQIAELQMMVFGKKRKPPAGTPVADQTKPTPQPRSKRSYRRPLPPASAITAEVVVPLPETCACGGGFDCTKTTTHDRYQEDIPLPELTLGYRAHLVTKYAIERGICAVCGKATTARNLSGQTVTLGSNIRLLITHMVSVVGLSYAQVSQLCLGLYGIAVSDGEIANSLHRQHRAWLPAYNQLKADIRAAPVRHYDETPWKIRDADNAGYAWVMVDAYSPNTVFHLATSRGAAHARALHGGDNTKGIHITDDYSAYRNLSGQQQLCWAHLYRCIRDLRYNQNLPHNQQPYVTWWYNQFATIYEDLRLYLGEPYDEVVRATQSQALWSRVQALANQLPPSEPDKLKRLKAQILRAGQVRLFVCLTADTPCDNNRAERDLRPLVLKRKRSFGSKTERGAKALATVLSLCTTTWRSSSSNPTGYFQQLALLG
ncbi:MAG: IS66 family transposase [Candidatus Saccharimonadales bacterium]